MILFYAAVAFLAGVAGAALGLGSLWPVVALGGAGLCLGWLLSGSRREALLAGCLVLLLLAGIDRYAEARPQPQPGGVALLNDSGEPVSLRGAIVDDPEEGETTRRFTLAVESYLAADGWQPATGRVLVTARPYPVYHYGDRVEVTGRLETPPVLDGFNYREYLARRGVLSQALFPQVVLRETGGGSDLTRLLIEAREPFAEALKQALPEPESALARGILLGERAAIPDELTDDFNRAGISHLIAISGQNVAIVAGTVVASLAWLIGRRPATAVAMLVIVFYALFVGAPPSVLRAVAMAMVMLGAVLCGRPGSALSAVVLAAGVLVAARPLLIDDVGFQLSFAATLGIVVAGGRLYDLFLSLLRWLPSWLASFLAGNLAISSAASVAVLPVIAGSFGRVSLIALIANLLATPAFVFALFASALAAGAGAIHETLGRLAGEVAYLPLTYLVRLGSLAADVPLASLEVREWGIVQSIAVYAVLAVAARWLLGRTIAEERPAVRRLRAPVLAAGGLTVVAAFVWLGALQPDSGRLQVTILDVGQGDAILIETPAGHRILVDGGPSGARLLQALGRALPATTERIDLMVLTHAQDDHVTGFVEALQRYEVGAALAGPLDGETAAYLAWRDELSRRGVSLLVADAGAWLDLGEGVRLEVLAPPPEALSGTEDDLNNNSVVLRLVYGGVSFLLTGDLAAEGEAALLASPAELRSTVLKVGHHGSDGSTNAAFLAAVDPALAVISVGEENAFGHPSPTTRLRLAGVPVLRTDNNGDVRLETDGKALWVDFTAGDYDRFELAEAR